MKNTPYFIEKVLGSTARNNLEKTVDTAILIVGGGMAGLSAAYALASAIDPKSITLVDSGRVGFSTTGRSSGLLVDSVEDDYCDMEPTEHDAVSGGIRGIVGAVEKEGLDCGLKRLPSLYLASGLHGQPESIRREFAARRAAGFNVELLDQEQLKIQHGLTAYLAMKNEDGFCLNPPAFCQTLAKVLEEKGVRIFEQTKIIAYDEKKKTASTPAGDINYQKLVFTNSSPSLENNQLTGRALLLSTIAAVTEPLSPEQYQQTMGDGECMGWDAPEINYMYFRPVGENRLLIGGSDRLISRRAARNDPASPKEKEVRQVRKLFERTFPHLAGVPFSHAWNGIIPSAVDNIPLAGEFKPGHYLGLYSPGLPNAFSCGKMLAQLIAGEIPETCRSDADRKIPLANRIRALTKYEPFTTIANKIYFS